MSASRGRSVACAAIVAGVLVSALAVAEQSRRDPDVARIPADATRLPNALVFKVLSPGTGSAHPDANTLVTVNYTMWDADGTLIAASASRATPAVWKVGRLMPGLSHGIPQMVVGEKRRFWIPQDLAYHGRGDRPPGALIVDVELLSMVRRDAPSGAELSAAPDDAEHTKSGVAWRVLNPASTGERPRPTSTVTISYIGWLPTGDVFDDSVAREQPLTVPIDTLMPGLAEVLPLMGVGEKRRVWIPEALAYAAPGPPRSPLVFDIELTAIQHALPGPGGIVRVRTNSPDARYELVQPDGTVVTAAGAMTFTGQPPGSYRVKPEPLKSYVFGIVASPSNMSLAPGGALTVTISYQPVVQ